MEADEESRCFGFSSGQRFTVAPLRDRSCTGDRRLRMLVMDANSNGGAGWHHPATRLRYAQSSVVPTTITARDYSPYLVAALTPSL